MLALLPAVQCLVAQSCPSLYDLMYYSPPGSSVHGDSPGKNNGVGFHALLQGISPTQGSNPVSRIAGEFFKVWASKEGHMVVNAVWRLQYKSPDF